jgi:catechol 2,3-dioxygenase-like lactoylglutathione lyase family enzyme
MFECVHHIAYIVSDMDDSVRIFHDIFELELVDRRVIEASAAWRWQYFDVDRQ